MDFKSDFLYGNTYRIKTVGIVFFSQIGVNIYMYTYTC